jgi:hypothetical protein
LAFEYRQGKIFSSRQQGPNRRYYLMGTEILSRGYSGRTVKLTTYFHVTPSLSTSRATPHVCSHSMQRDNRILSFGHLPIAENNIILRNKVSMYDPKRRQVKKSLLNDHFKNKNLLINVTSKPPQHFVTIMAYETSYF